MTAQAQAPTKPQRRQAANGSEKVLRKSFESRAAYAAFALSNEAPRYSATISSSEGTQMTPLYGMSIGEALFSNDLNALRREALAWDENGFEVVLHKEVGSSDGASTVSWAVRAHDRVPKWFMLHVFFDPELSPATPLADIQAIALEQLCVEDGLAGEALFRDKTTNKFHLQAIVSATGSRLGWG